jgi:hypothetical protein
VADIEGYRKGWLDCGLYDGGGKLAIHILILVNLI